MLSRAARENQALPRVEIGLPDQFRGRFSTLFAYGVKVEVPSGITVQELFAGFLGIDADYLAGHVQTILHDGKPVDDIFAHRVTASSTLALSAALPGLFGAAFRKGGVFSPLRPKAESAAEPVGTDETIEVTIKLFNLVAGAIGPVLLQRGIRIETAVFLKFLERHPDIKQAEPVSLTIDGSAVSFENLADRLESGLTEMILLVKQL